MLQLLSTIKGMTQGCERQQLEAVMAKGMQALVGADRVRLYKLEEVAGVFCVWLAVEATPKGTVSHDDGISIPEDLHKLSENALLDASFRTGVAQSAKARIVFPVMTGENRCFGFVEVKGKPLTAEQVQLAEALRDIFRNFLSILDYSELDTLTGLLNRKTFDVYLRRILTSLYAGDADRKALPEQPRRRRAHAVDHNHWLAVIDIDHFKRVNDTFGHSIGDEVLLMVASMMKASFRTQDKLFRFGGEEFVVLLKPTTAAEAHGAFERFRQSVAARSFPLVDHMTVSIGYSHIRLTDQPSLILDRADQALYWVKANGRNQACNFETLLAAGSLTNKDDAPDVEFF